MAMEEMKGRTVAAIEDAMRAEDEMMVGYVMEVMFLPSPKNKRFGQEIGKGSNGNFFAGRPSLTVSDAGLL